MSATTDRVLRAPEVTARTGLSRTTLWREMKAKRFPEPIKITSSRCIGWRESEVMTWLESRPKKSAA